MSPTYWPWAWPSPEVVTLTVATETSALLLPIREPRAEDAELTPFLPPELAPRPAVEVLDLTPGDHTVARSVRDSSFELVHAYPIQRALLTDSGIEMEELEVDRFTITEGAPLSARVRSERRAGYSRAADGWAVRLESHSEMTADATDFHVWTALTAFEGDACAVLAGVELRHPPRRELTCAA